VQTCVSPRCWSCCRTLAQLRMRRRKLSRQFLQKRQYRDTAFFSLNKRLNTFGSFSL